MMVFYRSIIQEIMDITNDEAETNLRRYAIAARIVDYALISCSLHLVPS